MPRTNSSWADFRSNGSVQKLIGYFVSGRAPRQTLGRIPLFQFGRKTDYIAGVAEMLLQSRDRVSRRATDESGRVVTSTCTRSDAKVACGRLASYSPRERDATLVFPRVAIFFSMTRWS